MTIDYLPLRTRFDKDDWRVLPTSLSAGAHLVETYHYAKSASPTCVYIFGLFLQHDFQPYGVSWWIPAPKMTVDKYNPGGYATTLALHRLVVHPAVPTNGASFLVGRSIRQIAQDGKHELLVTYADTWRGHSGAIYRASNWEYRGLTDGTQVWITKEGKMISRASVRNGRDYEHLHDLRDDGGVPMGTFPKHLFTMRLKLKRKPEQLSLFETLNYSEVQP